MANAPSADLASQTIWGTTPSANCNECEKLSCQRCQPISVVIRSFCVSSKCSLQYLCVLLPVRFSTDSFCVASPTFPLRDSSNLVDRIAYLVSSTRRILKYGRRATGVVPVTDSSHAMLVSLDGSTEKKIPKILDESVPLTSSVSIPRSRIFWFPSLLGGEIIEIHRIASIEAYHATCCFQESLRDLFHIQAQCSATLGPVA